jgi:hypothetical protein
MRLDAPFKIDGGGYEEERGCVRKMTLFAVEAVMKE